MRPFFCLLAFAAALPACSQRAVPQQAAADKPVFQKPRTVSTIPINTAPGDTVLVFQRTPCYGTCPSYTATVFRNGKVSYNGDRFVPITGQHTLSLDQAAVAAMLAEARRINFNGLEHEYRSGATDMPATVITTYLPGQKRYQVLAERGAAPQALQGYIDYLTKQFDPLAGIGADRWHWRLTQVRSPSQRFTFYEILPLAARLFTLRASGFCAKIQAAQSSQQPIC